MRVYVELSGEAPSLASAEAEAAAEAIGGGPAADAVDLPGTRAVELASARDASRLAARLALARRCLELRAEAAAVGDTTEREGRTGHAAAFRRLGRPTGGGDADLLELGRRYKHGGGRIDLERPERCFWLARSTEGIDVLLEEIATVDRPAAGRRRMPLLPFQRPVSLPPRLARAAANLARVRPADRVVDPFVGTGALLAEAGLLGGRTYGVDLDAEMVRGALRNFAHLKVVAEELRVGDAGEVEFSEPAAPFDSVLTDPPYGRSSSTGGETADALVLRVLPRWAERVRPGGRVVVVSPAGAARLSAPWELRTAVPVRVHRSLTREFRVYERSEAPGGPISQRPA